MSSTATRGPTGIGSTLWRLPGEAWAPLSSLALIYTGHLAYGALVSDVALLLSIGAAIVVTIALVRPATRADLLRLKGLALPGVLFLAVLAVVAWSLTPFVPGGPHPIWSYVDAPGAAAVDRSAAIVEAVKLLGLACFFLAGAACGGRDDRARFALQIAVLAGAIFAFWAIQAAALGTIHQTQGHRLEAFFLNPNTAGTVMGALFVLAVALLIREGRAGGRPARLYLPGAAALVLGVALLNTASRGAVIGTLVGLAVLAVLLLATGTLRFTRAFAGLLGGLALLALLTILAGDALLERLVRSEIDAPSRYAIWERHWPVFLDSPLLGYGLGGFEPINRSLLNESSFQALRNLRAPLNLYLQWLLEGGLLATIPMFLCVAALIALTLRGLFRRSRMVVPLAGLIALDVVFVAHGFTDSSLQTPSVAAFWAWALGLQVALSQGSSQR